VWRDVCCCLLVCDALVLRGIARAAAHMRVDSSSLWGTVYMAAVSATDTPGSGDSCWLRFHT
jgi:hypothetical protein